MGWLVSLRIDEVALNALFAHASVSLDIIFTSATEEHLGAGSHKIYNCCTSN